MTETLNRREEGMLFGVKIKIQFDCFTALMQNSRGPFAMEL